MPVVLTTRYTRRVRCVSSILESQWSGLIRSATASPCFAESSHMDVAILIAAVLVTCNQCNRLDVPRVDTMDKKAIYTFLQIYHRLF